MGGLQRKPDGISIGGLFGARKDSHAGDRSEHVVFVPWEAAEATEWVTKTQQWNLAHPNKFEIIVYDPAQPHHPTLARISADPKAVLYIRGHGNPGAPYIQVKVSVSGREDPDERKLPITEACQRLIGMGLLPAFSGAIKFYSCHSGTKLIATALKQETVRVERKNGDFQSAFDQKIITQAQFDKFRGDNIAPLNKSMAGQGADYMRQHGFTHCVYYGYLGPLGSTYEQDASNAWHKVVELQGLHDAPKHLRTAGSKVIDTPKSARPSTARVRV